VQDLTIIYRDPASLKAYAKNARTHSEEQIDQIAASIKEFGFTNPILLHEDGSTVGAGHGRLRAALQLKLSKVPTIMLPGLTEAQWKAYVIADNKLALNASWDLALLRSEISELKALDFKIDMLGFSVTELDSVFADRSGGLTDPDAVPDMPETPISVLGDVWACGAHRVACGDSTSADTVSKLLGSVRPNLMVTDPPYGVEYDPNWRNEASRWSGSNIKLGAAAVGKVMNDGQADWRDAYSLFPGNVAYVWHAALRGSEVAASLSACGFDLRSHIVWNKTQLVIGRGNYHWQHEPCWYAVKKGSAASWAGGRKQSTVWDIEKPRTSETGHGTQKPVECMRRPIVNNSSPGQAVYDPFLGSGTTLIAAQMEGRTCFGIELNPAYVDVIVKRWQDFTGQKATHVYTGEVFGFSPPVKRAGVAEPICGKKRDGGIHTDIASARSMQ
jgi:DNA modification methylase